MRITTDEQIGNLVARSTELIIDVLGVISKETVEQFLDLRYASHDGARNIDSNVTLNDGVTNYLPYASMKKYIAQMHASYGGCTTLNIKNDVFSKR